MNMKREVRVSALFKWNGLSFYISAFASPAQVSLFMLLSAADTGYHRIVNK
jgi:hypothetical protein